VTPQLEARLAALRMWIESDLDRIRDEAMAGLARLTRQVGQWTRIDRK